MPAEPLPRAPLACDRYPGSECGGAASRRRSRAARAHAGARGDGLSYASDLDRYTYRWKPPTGNDYKGTCREFLLTLDDQSVHAVWLRFVK